MKKLFNVLGRRISAVFLRISLSGLFILVPNYLVNGCGWYDPEDDYISMFSSEICNSPEFEPFFFSYDEFYYKENSSGYKQKSIDELNIETWSGYLRERIGKGDLEKLIYTETLFDIDEERDRIKKGHPSAAYEQLGNKKQAVLNYLSLSKRLERIAYLYKSDNWEVEYRENDTIVNAQLIKDMQEAYLNEKDPFLKERYAYQLCRTFFYSSEFENCVKVFETYKEFKVPGSIVYLMCMRYANGACYRMKKYAKANYYAALLFDLLPQARTEAFYYFHPQEEADWNQTVAMAVTDKQKIAIWNLFGCYADPMRAVQKIYALDKNAVYLKFLMTRVINVLELVHLEGGTNEYEGSDFIRTQNLGNDSAVTRARTFTEGLMKDGKPSDLPFWQTTLSYLLFLEGNYIKALEVIGKIDLNRIKDSTLYGQVRINRLISLVCSVASPDSLLEEKIYEDYAWLYRQTRPYAYNAQVFFDAPNYNEHSLRIHDAFIYCSGVLSGKYRESGQIMKSILCEPGGAINYETEEEVKHMLTYIDAPHAPFEQMLVNNYPIKKKELYEQWALLLTYKGKFKDALQKLDMFEGTGNYYLTADPFNERIKDCYYCDRDYQNPVFFSMRMLLQKMTELDELASKNKKMAVASYISMGDAMYNITRYGNARSFYDTKMHDAGKYIYGYAETQGNDTMFFSCRLAASYYMKAMELTKDKETKARCCWLLAKCEQNEFVNSGVSAFEQKEGSEIFVGKYFKEMQTNYSKTKYYKEVIGQCGYFKKYAVK
jgi:hypothetical protein